ncbi:MAG: ABC transporter substrate-binding protein [Rhizobacter sp.]|nr:ABC transporter substrate-binding protein [Chlorobiales bacterium]
MMRNQPSRHAAVLALVCALTVSTFAGCTQPKTNIERPAPTVGFVQAIEDPTIGDARKGFEDALRKNGFSDSAGTVKIVYRNAQGDIPTLNQIIDQFVADKVSLIAANTTLAMMTAVQKTKDIPIFMMVAPSPDINKLTELHAGGNQTAPKNLSGVYETLAYIDSTMSLTKQLFPNVKRIAIIYNSSEPNSMNSVTRLREQCREKGIELIEQAITSSNEAQQAADAVLSKSPDVFFALPDNVVFASFETILKSATDKKIPIITSEEGLVKRGAFAAYGADFYQWGFQAGESAAEYLRSGDLVSVPLQTVKVRKLTYNEATATALGLTPPAGAMAVK